MKDFMTKYKKTIYALGIAVYSLASSHPGQLMDLKADSGLPKPTVAAIEVTAIEDESTVLKRNIEGIVDFTIRCVLKPDNPRFANHPFHSALVQAGFLEEQNAEEIDEVTLQGDAYKIILGACTQLRRYQTMASVKRVDVLKTAEAAAVLLSPEILKDGFGYPHNHPVYKEVLSLKKIYSFLGMFAQAGTRMPELEDHLNSGQKLICQLMCPYVLVEDKAEFGLEDFIVNVQKRKALYGLGDQLSIVHGGVFALPIELFIHDQGHWNDILMPDELKEEDYETCANRLANIAGLIIEMADKHQQNPLHRNFAIIGGFNFIHENQIHEIGVSLANPSKHVVGQFKVLMVSLRKAMSTGLDVASASSTKTNNPPSTLTQRQIWMQGLGSDNMDTFNFTERFYSDLPMLLADLLGSKNVWELYKYIKFCDFCGTYRDQQLIERCLPLTAATILKPEFVKEDYKELPWADLLKSEPFKVVLDNRLYSLITLGELFTDQALATIMPETVEDFIYGTDRTLDRTRIYNGKRALMLMNVLTNWFEREMLSHLEH